jgi:hypothetical protein
VTNQTRPRPEVVYESVSQFGFAEMIVREAVVLLVLAFAALALPKSEEKKDRVFDRELSDKEHFQNEHHNPQYDHEAFLGEEAKTFDQLPPEESKRRLG